MSSFLATWAKTAAEKFEKNGIHFLDCPISGGPVRARDGELTMMASGSEESLAIAKPILDVAGKDVHIIFGGAGMGSTVKVRETLFRNCEYCKTFSNYCKSIGSHHLFCFTLLVSFILNYL
jgi:3-hydroxyisobutyrate dehydrogenase-like beta-hydroxyacid dehydrogenase